MPQAGPDEAFARLQVDVERRRRDLAPPVVEQARALPALVRRLVAGETGVALDPEHRAAHGARVGAVMRADRRQRRLQVAQETLERLAHVRLVVGLVRLEPGALVVPGDAAQEAERLVGKIGSHDALYFVG